MGAQALNRESTVSSIYSIIGYEEYEKNGAMGQPRILATLATALEKSIKKNEKLIKARNEKEQITIFHGSRAPALSIKQYIDRIFKYTNCSPSCFVVAYIYMERILYQMDVRLTSLNVHRLLITSVMLASKVIEDDCYNNAYYAKVGGITTGEINNLEMKFLFATDFQLHVSVETFENYCLQLEKDCRVKCKWQRPPRIWRFRTNSTTKEVMVLSKECNGLYTRPIQILSSDVSFFFLI